MRHSCERRAGATLCAFCLLRTRSRLCLWRDMISTLDGPEAVDSSLLERVANPLHAATRHWRSPKPYPNMLSEEQKTIEKLCGRTLKGTTCPQQMLS